MRLVSQRVFLLALAFVMSCRDSSGPATVSASFELTDIDGRSLPTPPAFTPGLTPTILSSTVTLDASGNATMVEHRTEWNGADATSTTHYTYKITDSRIEFETSPPCPPNAMCAGPPSGTLFLGRMSLVMGHVNSDPIIYNYRLTGN